MRFLREASKAISTPYCGEVWAVTLVVACWIGVRLQG